MKQCFAYSRVSTIKQGEGVSLEAQRDAICVFAERNDIEITKWFEEKETAAKKGRPLFNTMIKQLRQKRASGVVMHKIDRSARNFADWAKIGELADSGVDIHFATESLDFHSRGGRLTADIQAVIAADYIRNLREETIKGINGRLKQGLYPFRAPIGYLDQGGGNPKIPDPKFAPLIRKLFELYASGQHSIVSLHSLMHKGEFRNRYGNPVSLNGIETILNNPFYCGVIRIKKRGETYPGIHEPLIRSSLFQAVQDIKAGRHVAKTATRHNHTFRGLFTCAHCNTAAIGERQKGHVYYRCHTKGCPTKTVREETLDHTIGETLRRVEIPQAKIQKLCDRLKNRLMLRRRKTSEQSLQMKKSLLEGRLDKLTDALLDGVIDHVTYNAKKESLLLQLAEIQQALADATANKANHAENVEKFLELIKSLYSTYILAVPDEKRQIAKLATSNRVVYGRNAYVQPQSWLQDGFNLIDTLIGDPSTVSSRSSHQVLDQHIRELTELIQSDELQKLNQFMQKAGTHDSIGT